MNNIEHRVADKLMNTVTVVYVVVDESSGDKYYPSVFWTEDAARADLRAKVLKFFECREKAAEYLVEWETECDPDLFVDPFGEGEKFKVRSVEIEP